MTTWRDLPDEMWRLPLDHDSADRVIAGTVAPDDAPPGYAEAARVVRALAAPATADELQLQAGTVDGMRAAIAEQPAVPAPIRRRKPVRRFVRFKVGAVVVAGTLVLGTGMAMAGALPSGAQGVAATVLSKIGITVPNPDASTHAPTHPDNHGAAVSDTAHTTTATGAAKGAAISAVANGGKGQDAGTSSSSNGKGSTISQIATTTTATGVDKGAEISTAASGGKSQAGQHGSASSTHGQAGQHGAPSGSGGESGSSGDHQPPVTTPNTGGTGTAGQASGGKSDHGTTTAGDHSAGHSSAGSGNAGSHKP